MNKGIISRIAYNTEYQECRVEIIEDDSLIRYTYLEPINGKNSNKIGKPCRFQLDRNGLVYHVIIPI